MDRELVKFLFYITPMANVESILRHGILCHERASRLEHVDISNNEVQARRSRREGLPRNLHRYAPLYFNPRNPMMYRKLFDPQSPMALSEIAVVRIDPSVLDTPEAAIADGNAAATQTLFAPSPAGLDNLVSDEVFTKNWNAPDPIVKSRLRQRMCAELLVPEVVPTDLIDALCVGTDALAAELSENFDVPVVEQGDMFFR